jgi:hypothetical protein
VCVPVPRQHCTTVQDTVPRLVSYGDFLSYFQQLVTLKASIENLFRSMVSHERNNFNKINANRPAPVTMYKFTAGNVDFYILFLVAFIILCIFCFFYVLSTYLCNYHLHIYIFIYLFIYLLTTYFFLNFFWSQVPRQVCKDIPSEECTQVPREITTFKKEQECSTITHKQCKPVPKTVCD